MSTRKHTPRTRGFRPGTDVLEDRQLLSTVVSGMDSKGDTWTLRLIGPGELSVIKQPAAGTTTPASLSSLTDIKTITVAGTDPTTSRLVGTVKAGANSDGRVFFQALNEVPTRSEKYTGSGLGLLAIDMPNFWLGNTTPAGTTPTGAPGIAIPDGVDTLDFGGVDTTYNQPTPTSSSTSTLSLVQLGLPAFGGTRIIINRSVSSAQVAPSASGSTSTTGTVITNGVAFAVAGRLQLFQANEIDGQTTVNNNGTSQSAVPGRFQDTDPTAVVTSGTTQGLGGGTSILSTSPGEGSAFSFTAGFFLNAADRGAGVTGAIGNIRIGGNATNLGAYVFDVTGSGNDRISNFSVGGETNNVQVVAPGGLRNAVFGHGMDKTELLAHVINTLQANRGALNSTVVADRSISRVTLGGNVVNSKVLAGYSQTYTTDLGRVLGDPAVGQSPAPPPAPNNANSFGGMTVHVSGSVTNSVFAASDQTFTLSNPPTLPSGSTTSPLNNALSVFGDPNDILVTGGRINGKIEGTVSNATIAPNHPNQAFFAADVKSHTGPVVPPDVPQPPYPGPQRPVHLPGLPNADRSLITVGSSSSQGTTSTPSGTKKA